MTKGETVAKWRGKEYRLADLVRLAARWFWLLPAVIAPGFAIVLTTLIIAGADFLSLAIIVFIPFAISLLGLILSFVFTRSAWRWRLVSLLLSIAIIPSTMLVCSWIRTSMDEIHLRNHMPEFEWAVGLLTTSPASLYPDRSQGRPRNFEVYQDDVYALAAGKRLPSISFVQHVTPFGDTVIDLNPNPDLQLGRIGAQERVIKDSLVRVAYWLLADLEVQHVYVQAHWIEFVMRSNGYREQGFLFVRDRDDESAHKRLQGDSRIIRHVKGPWYIYAFTSN